MKAFDVEGGERRLVVNAGSEYFAFQAICPHQEVDLEEGILDGSVLTCHRHMWQWDLRTGAPLGLAELPLQRYTVVEEDGALYEVSASPVRQSPLFAGLSEATLDSIEKLVQSRNFEGGSVIYRPGDAAEDLCVLESGGVQFLVGRDERSSPRKFSLRTGEVFGWAALLEDHPRRIAAAICHEPSTVALIDGKALQDVLAGDPAAGYVVMRRLASLITRQLTPTGAQ
jgi:toluene monooxygenase system ferredoxin subunit